MTDVLGIPEYNPNYKPDNYNEYQAGVRLGKISGKRDQHAEMEILKLFSKDQLQGYVNGFEWV